MGNARGKEHGKLAKRSQRACGREFITFFKSVLLITFRAQNKSNLKA